MSAQTASKQDRAPDLEVSRAPWRVAHVRENRAAADLLLSPTDLAELDGAFPRPRQRQPLAML